jgi:hypothetical protein
MAENRKVSNGFESPKVGWSGILNRRVKFGLHFTFEKMFNAGLLAIWVLVNQGASSSCPLDQMGGGFNIIGSSLSCNGDPETEIVGGVELTGAALSPTSLPLRMQKLPSSSMQ